MSEIVIRAEGLSKQYRIGGSQQRASYGTLRDLLAERTANLLRRRTRQDKPAASFIWALKDVGFEVRQGEVLGVIGRNGAGKSTLLKILSRITKPTAGHAEIHGRVGSLLEVGTGFHPELTGRENVYLNGAILGMGRREIEQKFDEIVDFAGIAKFIDTPVKRYSSGMYTRLAFAVAAHLNNDILLVDEVLSVGDLSFQKKSLAQMESATTGAGRTVLFISHNLSAVQRLCPRTLYLKNGHAAAIGPTQDVIRQYMEAGAQKTAEFIQPHNPHKPMSVRRMQLATPDGKPCPEPVVNYNEGFGIILEYEVNEPVSDVIVFITVETEQALKAFTTADTDENTVQLAARREVGYYRAFIEFPPKWLNHGNYVFAAGLVRNHTVETYDRVEALNIEITEIGAPSAAHPSVKRLGVLQPVLPWTTEKIADRP